MNKFILLSCLFSIAVSPALQAQQFHVALGDAGQEVGRASIQLNDGTFAVFGYSGSYTGSSAYLLAKLKSDGSLLWAKTYASTGVEWGAKGLVENAGGAIAFCGQTYLGAAGSTDFLVTKLASDGTLQWAKAYGGTLGETPNSFVQTTDGGFAIAGNTASYGSGGTDMFLIKTLSDGSLSWAKTYGSSSSFSQDYCNDLKQTADGGYVLTGYVSSSYWPGAGGMEVFLLKTNASGTVSWAKAYGGTGGDYAYSVIQNAAGEFLVFGYSMSWVGQRMFVMKTTSKGVVSWAKTYGNTLSQAYTGIQTTDGGYMFSGEGWGGFNAGDYGLVKLDAAGTVQWSRNYGDTNDERSWFIDQTSDGGYMFTGYTSSFGPNAASATNIEVVKTDAAGIAGCNEMALARPVNDVTASIVENTVTSVVSSSSPVPSANTVTSGFTESTQVVTNTVMCPSALPIGLAYLKCKKQDENCLLEWGTYSETDNQYFTVQRSVDGQTFESIGKVNGAGNSVSEIKYAFLDDNLSGAGRIIFYRLECTGVNGEASYSSLISYTIFENRPPGVSLILNQAGNNISLSVYDAGNTGKVPVNIYDVSGNLVLKKEIRLSTDGACTDNIDVGTLTNGIYSLLLSTPTGNSSQRFSILR